MQLSANVHPFNKKEIENILKDESQFIKELLNFLPTPVQNQNDDADILLDETNTERQIPKAVSNKKVSRAKSLVELQRRLQEISVRKKLNYKEKLLKKGLKTRIKKKGKQIDKTTHKQQKINSEEKLEEAAETSEASKPAVNAEGANTNLMFSKFDFSDVGRRKYKKDVKKPEKMLENLKKQKEKLQKLKEDNEVEKVIEIKEKANWKNAIAKAQGEKVRDDALLLQKTIKRKEQKLKQSQKKWKERQEKVEKQQGDRQKKRQENIDKKKKEKKVKKMKQATKRGKIIPGF